MSEKHVNHSDEWFNMEPMNLVPEDLVKLSLGGLILGDCVDLCGHVPDDWRVSAGCHEKGQQDSHVKRVLTICYLKEDQSEFQETERRHKNLSHRLKVNEFASLMRQSSCPGTRGDKPNNVRSDLEHLRAHEHGELSTPAPNCDSMHALTSCSERARNLILLQPSF